MSRQKTSRRERFYSVIISALCLCAVVLVVAIVVDYKFSPAEDVQAKAMAKPIVSATVEPLTLRVELPPTQAPEGEAGVTPEPTEEPAPTYDFLPVYTRVETEEPVIAVTLDGCGNVANTKLAAQKVHEAGGKLTLFPYGQSVMKEGMSDLLKVLVLELGWQVENRTWSDGLIYQMASSAMATEIWSADLAVDYALNMDYGMHLFRMRGGSGAVDVRTHEYLKQLGYDGIAGWTVSGTDASGEYLRSHLKPGYIYQFDSGKESLSKMVDFVAFAIGKGYRCVTVNELLGLEPNSCTEPADSIMSRTLPVPEAYENVYVDHKIGDRAWQVLLIQTRLSELGYLLPDDADGIFGEGTSAAISQFQARCGMLGTGVASVETQERLFASDAPVK